MKPQSCAPDWDFPQSAFGVPNFLDVILIHGGTEVTFGTVGQPDSTEVARLGLPSFVSSPCLLECLQLSLKTHVDITHNITKGCFCAVDYNEHEMSHCRRVEQTTISV